jgi:hypothetical protein
MEFVQQGLDPALARAILDEAVEKARSRATGLLVGGIAVAGLGLIVSIATYSEAMSSGGTYFIWYGPVIAGAGVAFAGLVRLLKVRR